MKEGYNIIVRKMVSNDLPLMIRLLHILPPMGTLSRHPKRFLHAFLKSALKDTLGTIMVAFERSSMKGAGYVIAINHPIRFWLTLTFKYPFAIGLPLMREFFTKCKGKIQEILLTHNPLRHDIIKTIDASLPQFHWSPSSQLIARINFIGVVAQFRGRGIGQTLYRHLFTALKKKGVKKVEAHVDKGNIASLVLHKKGGWNIQELREGDYKATYEIS